MVNTDKRLSDVGIICSTVSDDNELGEEERNERKFRMTIMIIMQQSIAVAIDLIVEVLIVPKCLKDKDIF